MNTHVNKNQAHGQQPTAREKGMSRIPGNPSNRFWLYLLPGFLMLLWIIIVPAVWNIYLSFTNYRGIKPPQFAGLKTGTNSARRRALHKNVGIKPFPAYISSIRHFETREFLTKNRLIRHNWSGNSSGKAPPPQPGDVSWSGSSARSSSSQARPIRNG